GLIRLDVELHHDEIELRTSGIAGHRRFVAQRDRWSQFAPRVASLLTDRAIRRHRSETFAEEKLETIGVERVDVNTAKRRIASAHRQCWFDKTAVDDRYIDGTAEDRAAGVRQLG